jgi:hypothetical protein
LAERKPFGTGNSIINRRTTDPAVFLAASQHCTSILIVIFMNIKIVGC